MRVEGYSPMDETMDAPMEMRNVQCLCCSDGLAEMTAALRMRNVTYAALLLQGFIEPQETKFDLGSWAEGRSTSSALQRWHVPAF